MIGLVSLRLRLCAMAFHAQRVSLRAQQVILVAAVRGVARGATLPKGGLVMNRFFLQLRRITVAAETDVYTVGLW